MNTRAAWAGMWGIAAATVLAACGKDDGRTPGQKLDSAIEKVEHQADEAKTRAAADAGAAKERAREALKDTGEAAGRATQRAGSAVSDAVITASVKAELARDPGLSALRIDVDTSGGRVALRGSAPDEAARARATALAAAVKGVAGVDNRLVVAPK
jgi:hyperosmotically inducible protein